jgi:6-phosphogluconolactonase
VSEKLFLAVGSLNREAPYFQGARGEGVTVFAFDEETLTAERVAGTSTVDNPTFLSVDAASGVIYANSEVFGWHEGTTSALSFDPGSGTLSYINKQPTLGSITAYNMVSKDRTFVAIANYAMGHGGPDRSVAILPIREDGGLSPATASIRLTGTLGPDGERQERPHAHIVTETPEGGTLLVADLGLDSVFALALDSEGNLAQTGVVEMPAGAGPRHIAQHGNGVFVYVSNELQSSVSFLRREGTKMQLIETNSTISGDVVSHAADLHLSEDGRFLYVSNRGEDSIACFAVDQESGKLNRIALTSCGGDTPRNFTLLPGGRHMLVANQNSDAIVIFARNAETGLLTNTGKRIELGTPVCVKPFLA